MTDEAQREWDSESRSSAYSTVADPNADDHCESCDQTVDYSDGSKHGKCGCDDTAAAPQHESTLDRDIRFSPDQIIFTTFALRSEITRRERSIRNALESRAAGRKIQNNVLDEHYRAVAAAREVLANLEAARKQIAHRIAAKVNAA